MRRHVATLIVLLLVAMSPLAVLAQAQQADPPPEPIKTKNPFLSFIMSTFIPGSGQMYNGEWGKGVTMMMLIGAGYAINQMSQGTTDRSTFDSDDTANPGSIIVVATWAWAMYDAPNTSMRLNREAVGMTSLRTVPAGQSQSVTGNAANASVRNNRTPPATQMSFFAGRPLGGGFAAGMIVNF